MRPLFQADRHAPLNEADAWCPDTVTHWLKTWGEQALALGLQSGFPLHPQDAEDVATSSPSGLYCGALGVWVALERLIEAKILPPQNTTAIYEKLYAHYQKHPDTAEIVPSWFLGESAILTQWCLSYQAPQELHDKLYACIEANLNNPTQEILWGSPGTFLGALFMWEATADPRWRALCQQHIEVLWQAWQWFDQHGAWLWQQDLYGKQRIFMGAGHGWASNIYALWRAESLLNDLQYNQLRERTLSALKTQAISHAEHSGQTHAGAINWPPLADQETDLLMQWCHGAPGMICALQRADLPELDAWLYKGGLSILEAGPLTKGPSLCHGTAGNGYALLYLHSRLQRRLPANLPPVHWLAQARRFAMHALHQSQANARQFQQARYSLWTGDAGLACFLLDCLTETPRLPGIESLR